MVATIEVKAAGDVVQKVLLALIDDAHCALNGVATHLVTQYLAACRVVKLERNVQLMRLRLADGHLLGGDDFGSVARGQAYLVGAFSRGSPAEHIVICRSWVKIQAYLRHDFLIHEECHLLGIGVARIGDVVGKGLLGANGHVALHIYIVHHEVLLGSVIDDGGGSAIHLQLQVVFVGVLHQRPLVRAIHLVNKLHIIGTFLNAITH